MSDQKNNTKKAAADKPQLPNASTPAKAKSSMNILGIISLVTVVAATVFFQYRVEILSSKNSALEKHLSLITQQNQNQVQQSGQLEQQITQSKQQLESMNGQLAFMQQTLNQIPGARLEDWKLAETEYLLRLANQRINLQKEVSGAAALLDAANNILADLDDPALLIVREKISEEMLSLGNASEIDTQGIYAQLQALKNRIHNDIQPPKTFTQSADLKNTSLESPVEAEPSLINQLLSLVSVRTREQAFDAPLTTEQYQLLEHSLLLMLEQAQWALIKSDSVLYVQSLSNAETWIENKLRHQQADNMLENIKQLKATAISKPLPDISTSLRLLRQILKDRTYAPSAKQIENSDNKAKMTEPKSGSSVKENKVDGTVKSKVKQEQA